MPHARALIAIAREHEFQLWHARGRLLENWAWWQTGERRASWTQPFIDSSVRADQRPTFARPAFAAYAVDAMSGGSPETALRVLDSMLGASTQNGVRWDDAELHRQRGKLLLAGASPNPPAAEAAFDQAIIVARAQQARSFELRASLDLARAYGDTSREREARDLLAPALVDFTETPELPEIGEAQRLLAALQ